MSPGYHWHKCWDIWGLNNGYVERDTSIPSRDRTGKRSEAIAPNPTSVTYDGDGRDSYIYIKMYAYKPSTASHETFGSLYATWEHAAQHTYIKLQDKINAFLPNGKARDKSSCHNSCILTACHLTQQWKNHIYGSSKKWIDYGQSTFKKTSDTIQYCQCI